MPLAHALVDTLPRGKAVQVSVRYLQGTRHSWRKVPGTGYRVPSDQWEMAHGYLVPGTRYPVLATPPPGATGARGGGEGSEWEGTAHLFSREVVQESLSYHLAGQRTFA